MIDLLFVKSSMTPLNKNKTPSEATKDDSRKTTINVPTNAPIAAPVKTPATKQIAGSTPFLTNNANTYAATAYVDAKDKSISPDATKKTSGIVKKLMLASSQILIDVN